jgi:alkylation response protein AidB-like acyl-CoA dehydrogenase
VDFDPSDEQRAVLEAVEALLEKHAGPARAIALAADGAYDEALDAAVRAAGFEGIAEEMGYLEALLLVEAFARRAGVVALAARVLVAPRIGQSDLPGPIALVRADHVGPIRFAAQARSLLILDGDCARRLDLGCEDCPAVVSNFGFPMGRVAPESLRAGRELPPGSAVRLRDAWRLGLAGESVGCMESCLSQTADYLKQRRQFGRAIGSFQAVQHRLAECAIEVEASRWLTREAAHLLDREDLPEAPDVSEAIAAAAAFALNAADRVFSETHQLSGAIGFTREHDLHVWSMRLHALRQELGGVGGHRRALVEERWGRLEA